MARRQTPNNEALEGAVRTILRQCDENPQRDGLAETPYRVARAWSRDWTQGYDIDPASLLKEFSDGAEGIGDGMVVVRDIRFYSQCEHHLAPFFGLAHVAYIPDTKIVGLSKLARVVDAFSRRFQVQERMTNQIADLLTESLGAKGVGVVTEARHLCMESRGVQKSGAVTVYSALRGAIKESPSSRAELMSLIGKTPI